MRWTLKTIFYCHIETFAQKPSINSKIENSLCRSNFAIINIIMGKSEVHYGSHKKEEKVRPECSICILYVLNSLFPDLLATRIVEI